MRGILGRLAGTSGTVERGVLRSPKLVLASSKLVLRWYWRGTGTSRVKRTGRLTRRDGRTRWVRLPPFKECWRAGGEAGSNRGCGDAWWSWQGYPPLVGIPVAAHPATPCWERRSPCGTMMCGETYALLVRPWAGCVWGKRQRPLRSTRFWVCEALRVRIIAEDTVVDCLICARDGDGARHPGEVGGNVYEDAWWYAYHAPPGEATLGQLFLVSKRHLLDFAEMRRRRPRATAACWCGWWQRSSRRWTPSACTCSRRWRACRTSTRGWRRVQRLSRCGDGRLWRARAVRGVRGADRCGTAARVDDGSLSYDRV